MEKKTQIQRQKSGRMEQTQKCHRATRAKTPFKINPHAGFLVTIAKTNAVGLLKG